jgi:hypothetical protein
LDDLTRAILEAEPSMVMELGGMQPDPWQRDLLRSKADRVLLLCSRQLGKSTSTAFVALSQAYMVPNSLVLLISISKDQAVELFLKVTTIHAKLRLVEENRVLTDYIELRNGSRILALPGTADSARGYSAANLIVIDESARVPDDTWVAVLPIVLASRGRVVCLSTPAGQSGRFYELWTSPSTSWVKIAGRASESPRITKRGLELLLEDLTERRYRNEVELEFLEDVDSYFSSDAIDQILRPVPSDRALMAVDLENI